MRIAALNTHEARNRNLAAVLSAVREDPGRSRSEINARMPFSLQTMTNVVQELIELGLVVEAEEPRPGRKGSPHRGLHVAAGRCHVLGLQMRWNACTSALVDLAFDVGHRRTVPVETAVGDREGYLVALEAAIASLLVGARGRDIWAIALSAPLPILAPQAPFPALAAGTLWDDQRWFLSFWSGFTAEALCTRLERRFGLPVTIQNNPQSAAIAEVMRLPQASRLIYLFAGLGFGAAFVSGRALNRDVWRHGGEIGHVVYRNRPLSAVLSASGLRIALDLDQPQGAFEAELDRLLSERPEAFDPWLDAAEPVLRFLVNFLENAIWPDGIALGGFLPDGLIDRLLGRVHLEGSTVPPDGPARAAPRLFRARPAREAISEGVAIAALSYHANPDLPALIGRHRLRD